MKSEGSPLPQIPSTRIPIRIFISCAWQERKDDVTEIADKLEMATNSFGQFMFEVWRDENRVAETLCREVADAILHADLFIAFVNDAYQSNAICERVFTYAMKVKKRILVVKLVKQLSQGWLEQAMSGLVWMTFTEDHSIGAAYKELFDRINRMFSPPPPVHKMSPPTRAQSRNNNPQRHAVKERLIMALNASRYRIRTCIFGFLFFEPEEYVQLSDLAVLWGINSVENVRQVIANINGTFQCIYFDQTRTSAVLQPMFYDASFDKAREDWKLPASLDEDECHEHIRLAILMGAARNATPNPKKGDVLPEEIVAFQALRQQRRIIIEQAIQTLSPDQLAEICCMKSKKEANKQGSMTFLHFLYNSEWHDDVRHASFGGCKHSYRLILKILLKLKQAGINLGQAFRPPYSDESVDQPSVNILTETSENGGCFMSDVLNDADKEEYRWEWSPIVDIISQWKNAYLEQQWMKQLLSDNKTSLQVIGAIEGNTARISAFVCDIDAPPETRNATMLAAARIGSSSDFIYLYQQRESEQVEAVDEQDRSALMLASLNGHTDIVEFIATTGNIEALIGLADVHGKTAVMLAANNGHLDIVRLLSRGRTAILKQRDPDERTALALAVENGHLTTVEFLYYEYSHAVNFVDKYGLTILMLAAKNGHRNVVEFLYRKKQYSSPRNPNETEVALSLASGNGHLDVVEFLYDKEFPHGGVLYSDAFGRTALMFAATAGHLNVVEFLAKRCREAIKRKDEGGQTALTLASSTGRLDVVRFLHERFDMAIRWPDMQYRWPLQIAANNGHLDTVQYLVANFPDATGFSDANGRSALMLASANNHLQIVMLLYSVNPAIIKMRDRGGKTALSLAAQNNAIDVVKFLCENCGLDSAAINSVDNDGRTPLMLAALNGSYDAIQYLYEKDDGVARTDCNKQTALLLAAFGGSVDVLRFVCKKFPRSSQRDKTGRSAIMLAALNGKLDAVRFLMSPEANIANTPDEIDENGMSAMMLAGINGHIETVQFLYTVCPQDTKTADFTNGQTTLMLAAANGHLSVVEFLHDKPRESTMLRDYNDRTALMLASANGYIDIVKFLYSKYNFAVNVRDKLGQTAEMLANMNGHTEIVRFINEKTRRFVDNMMQSLVLD